MMNHEMPSKGSLSDSITAQPALETGLRRIELFIQQLPDHEGFPDHGKDEVRKIVKEWSREKFTGPPLDNELEIVHGFLENRRIEVVSRTSSLYNITNVLLVISVFIISPILVGMCIWQYRRDATLLSRLDRSEYLLTGARQKALTEVASSVFHEFSNSVWTIGLLCDNARRSNNGTDFDKIDSRLDFTRRMLHQLRGLIRGEEQKPEIISVKAALSAMQPMLNVITGPEINIEMKLSAGYSVEIIPYQFDQIITNIAKNAVEAMTNGGTLMISALYKEKGLQSKPCLELQIKDTGKGMDRKTQEQIFRPFFTTKSKDDGTGLGLAGVKNWVTGAGGEVSVLSKPDLGTTFTILLPLADAGAEACPQHSLNSEPVCSDATIVLIDDEVDALKLLATALEMEFQKVTAVSDSSLVNMTLLQDADIVVSDIRMPKRDGISIAQMVSEYGDMPMILITGDELSEKATTRLNQLSFVPQILFKPLSVAELSVSIRKALSDRQNPRSVLSVPTGISR